MEYELEKNRYKIENLFKDINDFNEGIEWKDYCIKILEGVLRGIPDIIRVFNAVDKTVIFFNEAGYKFYGKTWSEVRGKKCCEILAKKEKCEKCDVEKAIKTKEVIRLEKYVPEFNRFMECTCTPVLDDDGYVLFVVEQLKDITEKRILVNTIKESEERYRKIVDLSPEAIVIVTDNRIVLANSQACRLVGTDYSKVIGESIYKYVDEECRKTMYRRTKNILKGKKTKYIFDYTIVRCDDRKLEVEISSSYLTYKGKPAIQSVIRNITDMKRGLKKAALIQRKYITDISLIPDKFEIKNLFMPAKTVSGDFFRTYKVNENLILGIVDGKTYFEIYDPFYSNMNYIVDGSPRGKNDYYSSAEILNSLTSESVQPIVINK